MARPNESLSIAEEGVIDPWVRAGSKTALQRRVLRLGKPPRRWKVPSYADSLRRNIKEVYMYYHSDGPQEKYFMCFYFIKVVTWKLLNNLYLGCITHILLSGKHRRKAIEL
jgi:hypothetical protein